MEIETSIKVLWRTMTMSCRASRRSRIRDRVSEAVMESLGNQGDRHQTFDIPKAAPIDVGRSGNGK